MTVQVITRDGEAEYAVLPWATYQALLKAAGATAPRQEPAAPAAQASAAFGQLRMLREARSMSAEDLARSVGVSPHYLAMIESGERQPGEAIRRALAWNLDVAGWESES